MRVRFQFFILLYVCMSIKFSKIGKGKSGNLLITWPKIVFLSFFLCSISFRLDCSFLYNLVNVHSHLGVVCSTLLVKKMLVLSLNALLYSLLVNSSNKCWTAIGSIEYVVICWWYAFDNNFYRSFAMLKCKFSFSLAVALASFI